jgi:site-specific DNA-methyltransferase (adenine-specific)
MKNPDKCGGTGGITLKIADCADFLRGLAEQSVDLIIADSPYNIGKQYDSYSDSRPHAEFMAWMERWIGQANRVLTLDGSLWLFAPDEWVSEIDMYCRNKLSLNRRGWIVWTFTFGVACQRGFSRSHCHILYYTANPNQFTFNDKAVRVPSARTLRYADKRANPAGKLPDNTWCLLKEQLEPAFGGLDMDTWLVNRKCGTYKERRKHSSNQIPLAIMERIVLSSSNPGGLVVDPFLGTGTTAVACAKHGRRFMGCDISPRCVIESWKRVKTEGRSNVE